MRTVKGCDLTPGIMTRYELIVDVQQDGGRFWRNKPIYRFFDMNDPQHGTMGSVLDPDREFHIMCEPGTEEYREKIIALQHQIRDMVDLNIGAIIRLSKLL